MKATLDMVIYIAAGFCFLHAAVSKRITKYNLLAAGLLLIVVVRILDLLQPTT